MIQIRRNVFETNSSSTHSLTLCSKTDYDKWAAGEVLLCEHYKIKKNFVTWEEALELCKEYDSDLESIGLEDTEILRDHELYTFDDYWEYHGEYYETFDVDYKQGDEEVVAFGYYGYN